MTLHGAGFGETIYARVVSATQLSEPQLSAMENLLAEKFHKQVKISPEIDASLIGGFYIYVGGLIIDHSVKKQISDMRERIMRGVL